MTVSGFLLSWGAVRSHKFVGPRQAREGGPNAVSTKIVAHATHPIAKGMHILELDHAKSAH